MPHYFISDLHLDDSRPDLVDGFYQYLDAIQSSADSLYILGDFFEVWIGDDDDAPWLDEIKAKLKAFSTKVPTYLIHGNRDFLIRSKFEQETGITLLPEQHVINLYGNDYLLMHGDELCTDDAEYMAFRQQARNPQWQEALLQQPLEQRRLLAQQLRNDSKAATADKDNGIMDVNQSAVENAFTEHQCVYLIHGHTHRPNTHSYEVNNVNYQRIVLGDWGHKGQPQGWHIEINENTTKLTPFELGDFSVT